MPLATIALAATAVLGLAAPIEVYAAGDIADCRRVSAGESVAKRTAALIPQGATVLMLGDAVYQYATRENLESCYHPTWGVHLPTTLAVAGNHDEIAGRTDDIRAYFGDRIGSDARFARRLGTWLVVGLDSNGSAEALDEQFAWLEATLEEHRNAACTLAMWHAPLFSSGLHRGAGEHMRQYWEVLDRYGAEVVLNGHEHFYESFDPLDASGRPIAEGIREFVVGTGGARLYGFWRPPYQSRARIARHGVLHLTLDDGRFEWEFIDVNGRASDPGAASCR